MSSQPDQTQPDSALAHNALDMTAAEAEALKPAEAALGSTDGTAVVAAPAGEAAPAPAAGAAEVVDPAAVVAAAADEPAPVAAAAAAAPPPVFVPAYAAEARDFATEIAKAQQDLRDLKREHGAGNVEDDAYEERFEVLQDAKTALLIAQANAQTRAELNQQNADQSWAFLQNQFFSDGANAPIRASKLLFAAWEAGMQDVVNEATAAGRAVTDWELMTGARQKLVEQGIPLGGPGTAAAAAAATPQPKPDRNPPLGNVPQTLAFAPNSADPGSRTTAESLADMGNIEDLEMLFASKSEAERDAILRGVPGSYAD